MIKKLIEKLRTYGVRETLSLARSRIRRDTESLMIKSFLLLLGRRPLKNTIIVESHNDFDSNGGALYDYLVRNGYNEKYTIVWMLRNPAPRELPHNVKAYQMSKLSLARIYHRCTAKWILCSHVMLESLRPDQISVYMTHGAVALKNVKGKESPPDRITYCLYPSRFLERIFSEQMSLPHPNSKMQFLGYPSHDVFYDDTPGDLSKIASGSFRKTVLWMPTFRASVDKYRNDSVKDLPLGIPILQSREEYDALNAWLASENMLLIIKIHPMQDLSKILIETLSNIIVLDGASVKKHGVENYHLMKDVDALISDYSSAAADFLHTNRPIAYTLDDMEDYKIGFIVDDPLELMAGEFIRTGSDMLRFLENVSAGRDAYQEQRKQLIQKLFEYQDGDSCKRLIEFLNI